tara:strand:+ start:236 stop:493 length:258 start_codon:yes stop_codon:yes gene_type:complete
MRKFTNQEAHDVSELVAINSQIRKMSRNVRILEAKQKAARKAVKSVIVKHGEAHNANNIVTITPSNKEGYTVAPKKFDKFNIAER